VVHYLDVVIVCYFVMVAFALSVNYNHSALDLVDNFQDNHHNHPYWHCLNQVQEMNLDYLRILEKEQMLLLLISF
jgi:hypothetical protein